MHSFLKRYYVFEKTFFSDDLQYTIILKPSRKYMQQAVNHHVCCRFTSAAFEFQSLLASTLNIISFCPTSCSDGEKNIYLCQYRGVCDSIFLQ